MNNWSQKRGEVSHYHAVEKGHNRLECWNKPRGLHAMDLRNHQFLFIFLLLLHSAFGICHMPRPCWCLVAYYYYYLLLWWCPLLFQVALYNPDQDGSDSPRSSLNNSLSDQSLASVNLNSVGSVHSYTPVRLGCIPSTATPLNSCSPLHAYLEGNFYHLLAMGYQNTSAAKEKKKL